MKKILITGSSGFLGSHCVRYFQSQNHNVIGVDLIAAPTTTHIMDVCDFVNKTKSKFDLLIHFAAEVKGRINIEANYLNMIKNIEIDRQVFKWAIDHTDHIIYPSSCAVYPVQYQTTKNTPLIESMINFEKNCVGVSDHLYGWCKLTAERMLWQLYQETDLKIHVLRPFSGYGPGQSVDYPMSNLIDIVKNSPNQLSVWGNGNQTRDWVHVTDIVNTINWCAENNAQHLTVNVGTGVATSFLDLIKKIYKIVHNTNCPQIQKLIDKPSGMMHRLASTKLQTHLKITPTVLLSEGIKTVI